MAFSGVASAGANSYAWSFSDGGSANTQNTSKSFSTYGTKYITLTVGFSGGGTCVARDTIKVHDLPNPSFSLAGSKYCFYSHEICLTDNSTTGQTTTGYDKRLILWGDGASNSSTSPAIGDKICYSNYALADSFTLVVEVTNDKGCEAIWQQEIEVLHEHVPSFEADVGLTDCGTQEVCFDNDSSKPDDVKFFIWEFGNGEIDTVIWNKPCSNYPQSKTYTAKLTVELENGCKLSSSESFTTAFQKVEPDPQVVDTGVCYPLTFQVKNKPIFFANYYWWLIDVNGDTVDRATGSVSSLEPPAPGTYYVASQIKLGYCDTISPWIKVESLGLIANFETLNHDQCNSNDTVYTINRSITHPDAIPDYLWIWYDTLNPTVSRACSTSANNCFYDTADATSKHHYLIPDCYYPVLIGRDLKHGCIDSFIDTVSRIPLDYILFEAAKGPRCLGMGSEYMVSYDNNLCGGDVFINPDTLCNGPNAYFPFEGGWEYASVCDSNNYIYPSFIVIQGDNKVYASADTSDYFIDENQICVDTVWYDSMLQLFPNQLANVFLTKNLCLPIHAQWHFTGDDSAIHTISYQWSDPRMIQTDTQYRDTFPTIAHKYTRAGDYPVNIRIVDTNGCFIEKGFDPPYVILAGIFDTFMVDSVICPGVEFVIRDSLQYWYDPFLYWRVGGGPEEVHWDYGDGNGFSDTGGLPTHIYTEKGYYTIRMAYKDRFGCMDTLEQTVLVGGVIAGIQTSQTEFLCDQIVQFFDSSYSNLNGARDTINKYWWDFGDGTNTSQLKNPFHYYSKNGYFTLTHAVSNAEGCSDTARVQIYMRGPQPEFDIISDTAGCSPHTVTLDVRGINISEFVLEFHDPQNSTLSFSNDTVVSFTYNQPGVYDIYLVGSDSFFNQTSGNYYTCTELFPDTTQRSWPLRRIVVLPTPPADFTYTQPVCPGSPVTFDVNSDTVYKAFSWEVEGQYFDSAGTPFTYTFQDTGTYRVTLYPEYTLQAPYFVECFDTTEKLIPVSFVKSDFGFEQVDNCSGFQFYDSSINANSYSWSFGHPVSGDENESDLQNPEHAYTPDTGTFNVCLIVENADGCRDTICKNVSSTYQLRSEFYNVFTPGTDGKNDVFLPTLVGVVDYDLQIYNRWGELVFQTSDPDQGWDGTDMSNGAALPSGIYFYILHYEFDCTGEKEDVQGQVELIRE